MSANTVTDLRREDVLREFNLYPLWQLRVAASANEPTAEEAEITPVQDEMKPEQITSRQAVAIVNNEPDCSDLGWAELKKRVKACTACKLRAGCKQTVFGMGDEKADWLFVGSWPNEDDEASGNHRGSLARQQVVRRWEDGRVRPRTRSLRSRHRTRPLSPQGRASGSCPSRFSAVRSGSAPVEAA